MNDDSEYIPTWSNFEETLKNNLIGRKVVKVNSATGEIVLDNGFCMTFDLDASDCCSSTELTKLWTVDNIITNVVIVDEVPDSRDDMDNYLCRIVVVTEWGPEVLAESWLNPGNEGYYLTGWSLGVTIPGKTAEEKFWEELNRE